MEAAYRLKIFISSVFSSSGIEASVCMMRLTLQLFIFFLKPDKFIIRIDKLRLIPNFDLKARKLPFSVFATARIHGKESLFSQSRQSMLQLSRIASKRSSTSSLAMRSECSHLSAA